MLSMSNTQYHPTITNHKVLVLGDKDFESSLLHNYLDIHLDQKYLHSLGIDFGVSHLGFLGETHKFLIYQLSPDPKFTYLLERFLPGSKAIILPFKQIDEALVLKIDPIMKLVDQIPEIETMKIILFQEGDNQEGEFIKNVQSFINQIAKDYDNEVTIFQKDPDYPNSFELALHFILKDLNNS